MTTMAAILIALFAMLLYLDVRRGRRGRHQRALGLAQLNSRENIGVAEQYRQLEAPSIARDDFERIWRSLADFYELPALKLRTRDELEGFLSIWYLDPDRCLVYLCPDIARLELGMKYQNPQTWADLIATMIEYERLAGRKLVDVSGNR